MSLGNCADTGAAVKAIREEDAQFTYHTRVVWSNVAARADKDTHNSVKTRYSIFVSR
jgi:hypothetical protein